MRVDLYLLYAEDEPELEHWRLDPPTRVRVDGKPLRWCFAFDIEEGYADYVMYEPDGITPQRNAEGELTWGRKRGRITVFCKSDEPE
jgi:hypothetical protein